MRHALTNLPTPVDHHEWVNAVDEHLVNLVDPTSFEADQYRTLRQVLERKHPTKKVIAVTSPVDGDGKTTTAINLAGALAYAPDVRILLCDGDLRSPSLGNCLGLTAQSLGLVDLILDPGLTLNDVVQRHPRFPLSVLPSGRPVTVPYELLKSARLGELIEEASHRYDYVVLDTAPLVLVPDSRMISDRVDGFLMVVAAHRTPRKFLEDALNLSDSTKLIGIVFNGDDRPFSRYYGYYYGYDQGYGRHDGRRGGGRWTSVLDTSLRPLLNWLGHPRE